MNKSIAELEIAIHKYYTIEINEERQKFFLKFSNIELLMISKILEKNQNLIPEDDYLKAVEEYSLNQYQNLFNLCYRIRNFLK